jgi:hypothetical protein
MSDEIPNNPGNPQGDGAPHGEPDGDFAGVSGPELSSLLDEASSLASELKNDLGEPETPRVEAAEDELLAQTEDLSARVESELSEMERLAQEAGEALGAEPVPMHDGEDLASADGDDEAAPAIPDFMSEFTQPAASTPAADDQPVDDAIPDFMSEFTQPAPAAAPRGGAETAAKGEPGGVGVAADPDAAAALRDDLLRDLMSRPEPPPEAEATGRAALEQGPADDGQPVAEAAPRRTAATARLSAVAQSAVGGIATVMEAIDRPFHRIGDRIRWVAGLIGLATLATTIVLLIAHFLGTGPF